ncbi:MAG: glycosyltransferase family 4 protein [Methylococcales bacterium]
MLNICIVAREYPPETLWGGIGTFTYNLAQGLRAIGHNVDVLAFTFGDENSVNDNGVTVHRIQSPKLPLCNKTYWDYVHVALSPFAFFYSRKVRGKIEELHQYRKYDVIDLPEHIGEGFFTVKENRLPTLVRLYTPLSLIGILGLHKTTNALDYYLLGLMEKSSIKRCTIINSPSKALSKLVKKEFRVSRDIELIYNPIDTDKFKPEEGGGLLGNNKIRVLYVGGLTDRKGVHILAQSIPKILKKNDSIEFTIIGNDAKGVNGFDSMIDYMNDIFTKNDVLDRVSLKAPVPYDDLPKYYNSADISVVPSLYDNSPYTCLEAMSCGVPVVGASAGGMPEYIDDGENGLIIPPENVDALVAAVLSLAGDKNRLVKFGENARDKAIREFKREAVAEKITGLYLKAMEEHGVSC